MAKRKKARKSSKAKSSKATSPKHMIAHPKYSAKQFDCYGTHVRVKKGGPRVSARVYCGKRAKA